MRNWKNAEIVELNIAETAYGKNPKAREANAGKHPNNGAGSLGQEIPEISEGDFDKEPDVTVDTLS